MNNNVVILDYVRTPFTIAADPTVPGKAPGKMADVNPLDMLAPLSAAILRRTGVDPRDIENVIIGAAHPEDKQGLNIGRMLVLHPDSGLATTTQGDTLDKFCGSSMRTIDIAAGDIARGNAKLIIAAGVQSMSMIPMGGHNPITSDERMYDANPKNYMNMGVTAENLLGYHHIPREEQEEFALRSHEKAVEAAKNGATKDEIVPVNGIKADDGIRPPTAEGTEKMRGLKPAFRRADDGGTVTPATSSPLTDGASMVLLSSESYAKENNLPVLARIVSSAGAGLAPEIMGLGPVEASRKALERAGLTMNDMDFIELNEAFAAQSLAVLKEFNRLGMPVDPAKVNIDGGAIAIGHPLGASGARIVGHAAKILERTGKRYALATMCIGGGQGIAMVIENPNFKPN